MTSHDEAGQAAYAAALEHAVDHDAWDADRRAEVAAHELGLGALDPAREVGTLSGGQRTRLAIATVMTTRPACLLLDEPTNHLDDDAIEVLTRFLLRPARASCCSPATTGCCSTTSAPTWSTSTRRRSGPTGRAGGGSAAAGATTSPRATTPAGGGRRRTPTSRSELDRLRAATKIGTAQIAHNRGPDRQRQVHLQVQGRQGREHAGPPQARRPAAAGRSPSATRSASPRSRSCSGTSWPRRPTAGRLVQVRDLVVAGRLALDRLDVEAGEHLLVTGANGSGQVDAARRAGRPADPDVRARSRSVAGSPSWRRT